jgi:hypothetical protein
MNFFRLLLPRRKDRSRSLPVRQAGLVVRNDGLARDDNRYRSQAPPGARNGGSAPFRELDSRQGRQDDNHNRRRVARVEAATPVYVYARAGDEPFAEGTKTVNVSVNGGCITLSTKIARAQKIIVTNAQTDEDLACRVARSVRTGKNVVVGLEFLEPCPNFWGIEFETTPAADPVTGNALI